VIAPGSSAHAQDAAAAPVAAPQAEAAVETDEASQDGSALLEESPAERRSDFTFGLLFGGMLGEASGYPNDALKVDRDEFYTDTGAAPGGTAGLWLGGTFTDWFTFAFCLNLGRMLTDELQTDFGSFGFHVEAFPAWSLGGQWQELGVMVETGIGLFRVKPEGDDSSLLVDSGGASRFGLGLFYEGIRFWQVSMGPLVGADLMWSPSAFRPAGTVAWRTVLYSGP